MPLHHICTDSYEMFALDENKAASWVLYLEGCDGPFGCTPESSSFHGCECRPFSWFGKTHASNETCEEYCARMKQIRDAKQKEMEELEDAWVENMHLEEAVSRGSRRLVEPGMWKQKKSFKRLASKRLKVAQVESLYGEECLE
eukprot:2909934-Rhodomonas_salina.1